jgi:predicted transcriptional regulator
LDNRIISLTAQIVSAHIAHNDVAIAQLPAFIRAVYRVLTSTGQGLGEQLKAEPAVAATESVSADHLLCLDCGGSFKLLKRHISTDHQMTPDEYRNKWGLPPSYPMVAPDYAARRSKLALASGLGRKADVLPPPPKKRGRQKRG